jgi:hypothetical protein
MSKKLLLLSACAFGLIASVTAGQALAWTCASRCNWNQPGCILYVNACVAPTETCRAAALTASQQVRLSNGPGQLLTPHQKNRLRPYFGDLVDRVLVHYGALLAGEMPVGNSGMLDWGYSGQTFGHDIYLSDPLDEGSVGQLITLAHELTHTWQYERDQAAGGDFFRGYCRGWVDGGFSYDRNVYEIEAEQYTSTVAASLTAQ